ncbi:hypothetical protein F383_29221 [Gossypium arboreum]|uniref:Uncharacterized protein n=1 Tax=Gossypium arboreum TaxID=29729 RepID=A0A0B0P8U9_GOSAR|nr:hypothetical protein F383_29221 [Gossypium arboreum]
MPSYISRTWTQLNEFGTQPS